MLLRTARYCNVNINFCWCCFNQEFSNIIRRAFATRLFPPEVVDKLGMLFFLPVSHSSCIGAFQFCLLSAQYPFFSSISLEAHGWVCFFVVLSKGRATCIITGLQSVFSVGYYSKFSWLLQVSKEVKRNNIILRICGRNNDSNFEDQLHVVETIKGWLERESGFWNLRIFACGIRNPGFWNPESTTWNPESKTVLDSLTFRASWLISGEYLWTSRVP